MPVTESEFEVYVSVRVGLRFVCLFSGSEFEVCASVRVSLRFVFPSERLQPFLVS